MGETYFTRDGLRFLKELGTHNEKPWFEGNKSRFEEGLREPGLRLVSDLAPRLKKVSKHMVADTRPNGGSLSRIYRDTRFSKDKSPYKTALFIHFWHDRGTEDAAPAFYLHVEPGSSSVGGGVWHPATSALSRIREAIVKDSEGWRKAKRGKAVSGACTMGGEVLKKVPRGFDPEHPLAEDLRRKDYGLHQKILDDVLVGPDLVSELMRAFVATSPLLEFLSKAVGLPF
jgi:uncharacterized protein (TIGR02453 family)